MISYIGAINAIKVNMGDAPTIPVLFLSIIIFIIIIIALTAKKPSSFLNKKYFQRDVGDSYGVGRPEVIFCESGLF